ncbi:MAG: response regulator [Candidatus Margulisbacteria bacterium]|nr:response regulator [Candidatus Margulisiibacteriota bacterium]
MEKPLILVVEDETEYAQKIAKTVTSSDKYEAIIANSAIEALETLKKNKGLFGVFPNRVRCILLDIKMPEMDGLQFLENIRKDYEDSIEVIIITAYEDYEKWDRAIGGYVASYIKKPFDRQDLLDKLDTLFSKNERAKGRIYADTVVKAVERIQEHKKGEPDSPKQP